MSSEARRIPWSEGSDGWRVLGLWQTKVDLTFMSLNWGTGKTVRSVLQLLVKKFFNGPPSIARAMITAMLTVDPTPLSLENAEAGGVEFSFSSWSNFIPTCKQICHGQERAKGVGD